MKRKIDKYRQMKEPLIYSILDAFPYHIHLVYSQKATCLLFKSTLYRLTAFSHFHQLVLNFFESLLMKTLLVCK